MQIRAVVDKKLQQSDSVSLSCLHYRREESPGRVVHIRTVRDKVFRNLEVVLIDRIVERRPSSAIDYVHVCATIDEKLDDIPRLGIHGVIERLAWVARAWHVNRTIDTVWVYAVIEEKAD